MSLSIFLTWGKRFQKKIINSVTFLLSKSVGKKSHGLIICETSLLAIWKATILIIIIS